MRFLVPDGDLPARERPDASVPATSRIAAGTVVTEVERMGLWVLVATPDDRRFWVDGRRLLSAENVGDVSPHPLPPPPAPDTPRAIQAPAPFSLSSEPSASAEAPPVAHATGAQLRGGALSRPWLLAVAAIAVVAAATSAVMLLRSDEPGATAVSTSTLPAATTVAETTTAAAVATTVGATTASTVTAVRGTGTADDPFRLPFLETFSAPVADGWRGVESEGTEGTPLGDWTWDVVGEQLVATGGNSTVTAPRAPWFPEFDLTGADAIEVRIEIARAAGGAACGVALGTGNDRVIGVFVDPAAGSYLIWAPVTIGDEPTGAPHTSIRTGTNEVMVVIGAPESAESDVLSLSVNGQEIIDVTGWHESLGPVMRVAPMALVEPGEAEGECWFDDFSLTRQEGGS